jgi:hypothetical protein
MNELTLPEGLCTFSRGALTFTRPPSQEEWEQIGRYVHAARGSSLRWMADWRMEGRRQFGDAIVEDTEKHLQLEFKDLKAAEALQALESTRSESLSDEHHIAVSKSLPAPADGLEKARAEWQQKAQQWLEIAEKEGLSPRELQKSIKAGQIVRDSKEEKPRLNVDDRSVGIVTIEGVSMQFNLWLKKVREEDGFPGGWDSRRLGMVLSLLEPMALAYRDVLALLEVKDGGEV